MMLQVKEGLPMKDKLKALPGALRPYVKWIVIAVIAIAIIVIAIVAATLPREDDDPLANVDVRINYFANGGEFDNHKSEKTVGYAIGAFPLNIGYQSLTSGNAQMNERDGYAFEGWYLPAKDENGELIYEDEAHTVVALGEPFDFTKRLESGGDVDIYAKWSRVKYVSVLVAGTAVKDTHGNTYELGSVIKELNFKNGSLPRFGGENLDFDGDAYTFVEYYYDEACTEKVDFPIAEDGDTTPSAIYARFLVGDWEIVSSKDDAKKMLKSLAVAKNYYLICDIDLEGESVVPSKIAANTNIKGNGYTISNFKVTRKSVEVNGAAIFGEVGSGAEIHDLKLENVELTLDCRMSNSVYFLFTGVADDAVISGLEASGRMTVSYQGDGSMENSSGNYIAKGADELIARENIKATVELVLK